MAVPIIRKHARVALSALFCAGGAITLLGACGKKEITGGEWKNVSPEVRFVNVPPDSSTFSSNPTVFWSGTDIDGRVVAYRYVVVSQAEIAATALTPEQFVQNKTFTPDARWTKLEVTLDDPQASARIPLQADLSDPVRVVVKQYLFLQALDDEGAFSKITYRFFGRNAHFPETTLLPFQAQPYINVQQQIINGNFVFGGANANWVGTDSLDFPGEQPDFEYEWRLYGPFNAAESLQIANSFVRRVFRTTDAIYEIGDTLFDTTFDYTRSDTAIDSVVFPPETTITVKIVDYDTIEINLGNETILTPFGSLDRLVSLDSIVAPRPNSFNRLIESSFNPLTGEPWTVERAALYLDMFRNDPSAGSPLTDTTRIGSFLFWVRVRDDANVPDPTPSFAMFNVIEPRHERDLLVLDLSLYLPRLNVNGQVYTCFNSDAGLDTSKRTMCGYISRWKPGSVGPDASSTIDTGTWELCGKDSLLLPLHLRNPVSCAGLAQSPHHSSGDYLFSRSVSDGSGLRPTARDILKHKVVIIVKDNITQPLVRQGDPNLGLITSGVATGVNFWVMSKASFQESPTNVPDPYPMGPNPQGLPFEYSFVFGINGAYWQAWYGMQIERPKLTPPQPAVRNEDFVGTYPVPEFVDTLLFPRLNVDPTLLRQRLRWEDPLTMCSDDIRSYPFLDTIAAIPEVGYVNRTTAEPLYRYRSRFGQDVYPFWPIKYDGRVVAVRNNATFFRTSHWCFTPLGLDSTQFQVAFNTMMDWMFEPWGGLGMAARVAPSSVPQTDPKALASQATVWRMLEEQNRAAQAAVFPGGVPYVRNYLEYEDDYKRAAIRAAQEAAAALSNGAIE